VSDSGESSCESGDCGNVETVRRASENQRARCEWRADMYRSESFRSDASQLLSVDRAWFDLCLDALLVLKVISRSGEDSSEADGAEDGAFILAALGADTSDPTKVLSGAKRILMMEFQCEFGDEATDDRKGKRRQPIDPYKDLFGNQRYGVMTVGSSPPPSPSDGHPVVPTRLVLSRFTRPVA
jgi:hypothetical protein